MEKILSSELVLNDDGSIYHLHLRPEDIADTIILVGDQDRVPEVSKHFDRIEVRKNKREFHTHTGYLGSRRISVISTGIGTDNIDIVLNELDALVNIDLASREVRQDKVSLKLIRIGTSGSLQQDIPVDTILASSFGFGLDSLMSFYELPTDREEEILHQELKNQLNIPFIQTYLVKASDNLTNQFFDFQKGITATCCGFYGPQGRKLRGNMKVENLITRLHKMNYQSFRVTNFEMETAAIYGMARLLGHEAISINAILANRITHEFSQAPKLIIEKTIMKVLEKLI